MFFSIMVYHRILNCFPCSSVGKVMSLLLNILSRLVTTFLPRSKRLCELITDSMDMSQSKLRSW